MKRAKLLTILIILSTTIGCSSIPGKDIVVARQVEMQGRDILTVVMTHLEKKKEIAAFNAGIVSEVGSPKIVPKVPEGVDAYVEEALREAMANRAAPVLKDLLDVFTETLAFDTLLLVKTEAADVTDLFIGIGIHTYPDSMKVTATLFDAKEGGLIGAITSPVRVMDESSRLADIGAGGQSVVAELLKKVAADAPKKEEKGGEDPKKLLRACKKGDGAACGKIGDLFMSKTDIRDHRRKAEDFYRQGCDLEDKYSCNEHDKLAAGEDDGDERPAKKKKKRSYDEEEDDDI